MAIMIPPLSDYCYVKNVIYIINQRYIFNVKMLKTFFAVDNVNVKHVIILVKKKYMFNRILTCYIIERAHYSKTVLY